MKPVHSVYLVYQDGTTFTERGIINTVFNTSQCYHALSHAYTSGQQRGKLTCDETSTFSVPGVSRRNYV
jgi:hypothetical protein